MQEDKYNYENTAKVSNAYFHIPKYNSVLSAYSVAFLPNQNIWAQAYLYCELGLTLIKHSVYLYFQESLRKVLEEKLEAVRKLSELEVSTLYLKSSDY